MAGIARVQLTLPHARLARGERCRVRAGGVRRAGAAGEEEGDSKLTFETNRNASLGYLASGCISKLPHPYIFVLLLHAFCLSHICFPPSQSEDSAGQTNIFSVEPKARAPAQTPATCAAPRAAQPRLPRCRRCTLPAPRRTRPPGAGRCRRSHSQAQPLNLKLPASHPQRSAVRSGGCARRVCRRRGGGVDPQPAGAP